MNIKRQNFVKITAASALALSFAACGSDSGNSPNTVNTEELLTTEEVVTYTCADGSIVYDASACPSVIDPVTGETVSGVIDSVVTVIPVSSSSTTINGDISSSSRKTNSSSSSKIVIIDDDDDDDDDSPKELDGTETTLQFAKPSSVTITNNNGCLEELSNSVTINCSGNYYLTGSANDFSVIVNVSDSDTGKVDLYLYGLDLTSSDAPIFVRNAEKTRIHIVKGTTNSLTDGSTRTTTYTKNDGTLDTTSACIYAKDDINIKGSGTLTVTANYNNGIHTSNDLKIKNGNITVKAKNNAVKGKGSVSITGGTLNLTATNGDGIKSDEGEDENLITEGKGIVSISGGSITIKAGDDGIQAYNQILVEDAEDGTIPSISITSTGKGIVSTNSLYINGGEIDVNATDDGLHSNMNIYMNGGNVSIASGDDGIHADSTLRLSGSTINITKAYEGMEAFYIRAEGGVTSTYASDDGWNAAGGVDGSGNDANTGWGNFGGFGGGMTSSSKGYIFITGGYHYVSASGNDIDVLDANGTATQSGGVLILEIPGTSSGNSSNKGNNNMGGFGGNSSSQCSTNNAGGLIDTDSGFSITGGVLLGFGSQTEEYPNCTQTSYSAGTYYGTSNAAFAPKGSGSMIIYGGSVSSVAQVDVSGMTEVAFPNGLKYYYK